jgi:bifunctional DNase/RNase
MLIKEVERATYMIPVIISNVGMVENRFVLFLHGDTDVRSLPIFVDELQAQSIMVLINGAEVQRPLTHDLVKTMFDTFGFRIIRAEISEVKDDTFFARLYVEGNGKTFEFDARPSDALCLALRFGAAVFVDEKVMDTSGIIIANEEELIVVTLTEPKKLEPVLKHISETELSVLDILNKNFSIAIKEERYEEAARLRDEIRRSVQSN